MRQQTLLLLAVVFVALAPQAAEPYATSVGPLALGQDHVCLTLLDRTVQCFGYNYYHNTGGVHPVSLVTTGMARPFRFWESQSGNQLVARGITGHHFSCELGRVGTLRCCGVPPFKRKNNVVCAKETQYHLTHAVVWLPAPPLLSTDPIVDFAAGWNSMCELRESGGVRCLGLGDRGQTALGSTKFTGADSLVNDVSHLPLIAFGSTHPAIEIRAGLKHYCAVFLNRKVRCWGIAVGTGLGDGDPTGAAVGDAAGEIAALPFLVIAAPANPPVRSVAAGEYHSCALTMMGAIYCWGDNGYGQLGRDHTQPRMNATQLATPVALNTGADTVDSLAAGLHHTCALAQPGGKIYCWGRNDNGQLGQGDTKPWGSGSDGSALIAALPAIAFADTAVAVAAGSMSSCALFGSVASAPALKVRCWGLGYTMRLGTNSEDSVGDDPGEIAAIAPISLAGGVPDLKPWVLFPLGAPPQGGIRATIRGPRALTASLQKVRFTDGTTTVDAAVSHACVMCTGDVAEFQIPAWPAPVPPGGTANVSLLVSADSATYVSTGEDFLYHNHVDGTIVMIGPLGSALVGNTSLHMAGANSVIANRTHPRCIFNGHDGQFNVSGATVVNQTAPDDMQIICQPTLPQSRTGYIDFFVQLGDGYPIEGPFSHLYYNVSLRSINMNVGYVTGGEMLVARFNGFVPTGDPVSMTFGVDALGSTKFYEVQSETTPEQDGMQTMIPNFLDHPDLAEYKAYAWSLLPAPFVTSLSFNGQVSSLSFVFHVIDTPSIHLVLPDSSPIGGGSTVEVKGSNVIETRQWGGKIITEWTTSINTTYKAFVHCDFRSLDLVVLCPVPPVPLELAGIHRIRLTLNGVQYTAETVDFTYYAVLAVSPRSGPISGGSDLEVTGIGFVPAGEDLRCQVAGAADFSAVFVSDSKILCTTPDMTAAAVSAGFQPIAATNTRVTFTSGVFNPQFQVYVNPQITLLTPNRGPTTFAVTITLRSAAALPTITLGTPVPACMIDSAVGPAVIATATSVKCTVPLLDKTGVVLPVFLSMNGADFFDTGHTFSYIAIYVADPVVGPAQGGSTVLVSGTGFLATGQVLCRFGAVTVPAVVQPPASLECVTPPHAAGTVPLSIALYGSDFTADPLAFTFVPTPSVTALAPPAGPPGYVVTVFGDNLAPFAGMVVSCRFGTTAVPATGLAAMPTSVTCAVPPLAAGLLQVSISLNDGADFSSISAPYQVFTVGEVTPLRAPVVATADTSVVISGTGFIQTATSRCHFGTFEAPVLVQKPTQALCYVPAGMPVGTHPLRYTEDNVVLSAEVHNFQVYAAPTVSALDPPGGPSGGGTIVTVHGTNFVHQTLATGCRFGRFIVAAPTLLTSTSATCVSPPGAGSLEVALSFNGGFHWTTDPVLFGFFVITAIIPSTGPASGGSRIQLSGSGFTTAPSALCKFGAVTTVPATILSSALVECIAPPLFPGTVLIDVSLNGVDYTGQPVQFIFYTAPRVTLLSPASGPGPGYAHAVTVRGTNFNAPGVVPLCKFDATLFPPSATSLSAGRIVCPAPVDSTGTVAVEISLNGGFDFTADALTYQFYAVLSLDPGYAPTTGGTVILLSGTGFIDDPAATCRFGSIAVAAEFVSSAQVRCRSPFVAAPSFVSAEYAGPGGAHPTADAARFEFYTPPALDFLSPNAGPTRGGLPVTLYGRDLRSLAGVCKFGLSTVPATAQTLGDGTTVLVCIAPSGSGSVLVEVSLNSGFDFSPGALSYYYFLIFQVTPALGPSDSTDRTTIRVQGGGFLSSVFSGRGGYCKFGTVAVSTPYIYRSEQELECIAPQVGLFTGSTDFGIVVPPFEFNGTTIAAVESGSFGLNYTFYQNPTVLGAVPLQGPTDGGSVVSVSGRDFIQTELSQCHFGPTMTAAQVFNSTMTLCPTPLTRIPATLRLTFNAQQFHEVGRYQPYGQESRAPTLGPISGATLVTVDGFGFFADSPGLACKFGSAVVAAVYAGQGRITCYAPPLSAARSGVLPPGWDPEAVANNGTAGEDDGGAGGNSNSTGATNGTTGNSTGTTNGTTGTVPGGTGNGTGAAGAGSAAAAAGNGTAANGSANNGSSRRRWKSGVASGGSVASFAGAGLPRFVAGTGDGAVPTSSSASQPSLMSMRAMGAAATAAAAAADAASEFGVSASSRSPSAARATPLEPRFVPGEEVVPLAVSADGTNFAELAGYDFLYHPLPKFSAVTPQVGSSSGSVPVTVRGSGFLVSRSSPTCLFGGAGDQQAIPVSAEPGFTDTELVCVTVTHSAGLVPVRVALNAQQYLDTSFTFTFTECVPGFFAKNFRDPCSPCALGTASPRIAATQCDTCRDFEYADRVGMTECVRCPPNTFIQNPRNRTQIDSCVCGATYFHPDGKRGEACVPCPAGANCEGGQRLPYALPGYWKADGAGAQQQAGGADQAGGVAGLIFLQCSPPEACPGGEVSGDATGCAPGYTNRLCAECDEGYFKRGQLCLVCPKAPILTIIFFCVFILIVAIVLFKMVGPNVTAYGGTINITVYFMQVLGILAKLELKWPTEIEWVMSTLGGIVSLDLEMIASECSLPGITYSNKFVAKMTFPLVFLLLFALIYILTLVSMSFREKDTGEVAASAEAASGGVTQVALLADSLISAYLLHLVLSYLFLISTAFELFDCTLRADGSFSLDVNPSLLCYDDWWWRLVPIGIFGIIAYGLAVPVCCYALVRRNMGRLDQPRVIGRLGSIFTDYRSDIAYWESMVMVEKFAIAACLVFFTTFVDVQIVCFLLVTVMGLATHIVSQPFFIARYNKLQTLLRWASCIMVVSGLIFRSQQFPDAFAQIIVTGGVFLVIILSCAMVAGIVVYDVVMIHRSLGASFDDELSRHILTLTVPQGKTVIMEWLGTATDNKKLQRDFAALFVAIGRFYSRYSVDPASPVFLGTDLVYDLQDAADKEEAALGGAAIAAIGGWVTNVFGANGEPTGDPGKGKGKGKGMGAGIGNGAGQGKGKGKGTGKGKGKGFGNDAASVADDGGGDDISVGSPRHVRRKGLSAAAGAAAPVNPHDTRRGAVAVGNNVPALDRAAGDRRSGITPGLPGDAEFDVDGNEVAGDARQQSVLADINSAANHHESWECPLGTNPADFVGDAVIRHFSHNVFMAPVVPCVRVWFLGLTELGRAPVGTGPPKEARALMRRFVNVFTEIQRFAFFAHIGVKTSYRPSSQPIPVRWLDDLRPADEESDHGIEDDDKRENVKRRILKNGNGRWWDRIAEVPEEDRLVTRVRALKESIERDARDKENKKQNEGHDEAKLVLPGPDE